MNPNFVPLGETPFTAEQYAMVQIMAHQALTQAYAPYSKFQVGCAILCPDGSIFSGCNVETANYDGIHAEQSALAAMVRGGRRAPLACLCLGALEGQTPIVVMSCGKCRQAINELAALSGTQTYLALDGKSGPEWSTRHWFIKIADLLPYSFGPIDIGVDIAKYRR